jgi:heme-degrading monooxygenase HmoA
MNSTFVILWKFRPKEGRESEFERAYGENGEWVRFFKKGKGYIKTEFYQDANGEYLTLDEWTSKEAYDKFRSSFLNEYQQLDRKFEALTAAETHIGSFVRS